MTLPGGLLCSLCSLWPWRRSASLQLQPYLGLPPLSRSVWRRPWLRLPVHSHRGTKSVPPFLYTDILSHQKFTLQANTHNSPNGGVMSKNMHFHLMLPTSKICTIKVRTSTMVIYLTRRHTLLGCETKAMTTKS